jgi:hypothetical protein
MRKNSTGYPYPAGLVPGDKGALLTLQDVARRYRRNADTIRRWAASPGFPRPLNVEGRHLFYLVDLVAWELAHIAPNGPTSRAARAAKMPLGARGRGKYSKGAHADA